MVTDSSNKQGPAQVGAPLKFQKSKYLKYAKDTVYELSSISVPKNTPKDTHDSEIFLTQW